MKARWIPESYTETKEAKKANTIIYYDDENLKAIAYSGKRSKPDWHYRYRTHENMMTAINEHLQHRDEIFEADQEWKEKKKFQIQKELKEIEPGKTILYTSWGYDQTNVDFYLTLEKKGKTLTLQHLGSKHISTDAYSSMASDVLPDLDNKIGQPFKQRIGTNLKINGQFASIHDGRPKYSSWYA